MRFAPEATQGHPQEGTEGTQGHPQEGTHGHVHFQEELHDSAVMVTQENDGHFLVKVGDRGTTGGMSPSPGGLGGSQLPKIPRF